MIKIARTIYTAPDGAARSLAITIGRVSEYGPMEIVGAEYEVDGERVSAEEFRDVMTLLALPSLLT